MSERYDVKEDEEASCCGLMTPKTHLILQQILEVGFTRVYIEIGPTYIIWGESIYTIPL